MTPEFIEGDGCELFKQLHSRVGTLAVKDRLFAIIIQYFDLFVLCNIFYSLY